jgi:hypothetical protein
MATKRIKDISTTATTFAADDFIALDASSVGTRKMAKASLITQVGANYLEKADNLSDVASKDTSKLNLEVPNVGTAANEVPVNGMLGDLAFQSSAGVVVDDLTVDGQLTAAVGKPMPVNGPTMRFDGSNDYVEFADNDAFTFSDGASDLPFSVSAWVKPSDNGGAILGKQTGGSNGEWILSVQSDGKVRLMLFKIGGTSNNIAGLTTQTLPLNKFSHVTATYDASKLSTGLEVYVNGSLDTGSQTSGGTYTGMGNGAAPVRMGKSSTNGSFEGEIRDVKLFNKELSAAEVREVYSNGQLPESFAESTGAIAYVSDFSAGTDSVAANAGTGAGNIDSIGGEDDNYRFTLDTAVNQHFAFRTVSGIEVGKRYKLSLDFYISSSNSDLDGIRLRDGSNGDSSDFTSPLTDTWNRGELEYVAIGSQIRFYALSAGAVSFQDAGGDDVFYVRNVRITQIGSVLDARAEQFDTSTGKLYDLSGNDFVGTQSGGVQSLGKKFPVYQTGTWTPTVSFGGGSTGVTYNTQLGTYTRVGNTVHIQASITLNSVGIDTGGATIDGLPFPSYSANYATLSIWSLGMSGLTSNIFGRVTNSGTKIDLYDSSATGSSYISNVNFTASSILRFSATYQIQ